MTVQPWLAMWAQPSLHQTLRAMPGLRLSTSALRPTCGLGGRVPTLAAAGAAVVVALGATLQRGGRRRRSIALVVHAASPTGTTIDFFKQFGPSEDPFEIQTDKLLGVGGQGSVYRCNRLSDPSKHFAVKAVPIWRLQNDPESSSRIAVFEKEMECIMRVQGHPNIAGCVGCWDEGHPYGESATPAMYKMMVVELVEGGSLGEIIAQRGRLQEDIACNAFRQVLAGLKFMHGCRVLHRDLKVDNILVCSEDVAITSKIKLIDFGVARVIQNSYAQSCVGTRDIMAPEILCAKLLRPPPGQKASSTEPMTFSSPREASPGFGLATARPDGKGALITSIEPGGQGEKNGVQAGWAVHRINGTDVSEMLFVPDQRMSAVDAPEEPSIVKILQGLEGDFTMEFLKLPSREFTEAVDLWSLGCVLYTMLAGQIPFSTEQDILDGNYDKVLLVEASQDVQNLIQRLLTLDPKERATVEQVESHPWLTTV